jgi:hypothetical protein
LTILKDCPLVLLKLGWRKDKNLGSEECGMMASGLSRQQRKNMSIWAEPSVLSLERSIVAKWQRCLEDEVWVEILETEIYLHDIEMLISYLTIKHNLLLQLH